MRCQMLMIKNDNSNFRPQKGTPGTTNLPRNLRAVESNGIEKIWGAIPV